MSVWAPRKRLPRWESVRGDASAYIDNEGCLVVLGGEVSRTVLPRVREWADHLAFVVRSVAGLQGIV